MPQQDPAMRVSTAPPAHCGRGGGPPSLLHPARGVLPNMPQQDPAMRVSTAPPAHCGRGGTTLSSPPHSVGGLTQHAFNKIPSSGRGPPRLLPIAGGGTTLSSPPHSVGCPTQHAAIIKTPHSGCPPRLLPIAGGGDHTLLSTPLRGVSNQTCHQQDPA